MKTVTFLLLRGLPASGKSTHADKLVAEGWKRLNKDMMREMIDGGRFSPENETYLNEALYAMAEMFLESGFNVVSDNMNWNAWHFERARRIAKDVEGMTGGDFRAFVAVKDFDTDIETCIERDANRTKPVTAEVIRKIAAQWIVDGKWPDIQEYLG